MLFSELRSVLDGMIALPEFAKESVSAVYVQLNEQLQVIALVYCLLPFDDEGRVQPDWDLPLRSLALTGGPGPSLGAGPIRLVCRSQCDPQWHGNLWEPREQGGRDPFEDVRRLIRRNRLGLLPRVDEPVAEPPLLDGSSELVSKLTQLRQRDKQWQRKVKYLQERLDATTRRADELAAANDKLRAYVRTLKTQYLKLKKETAEQSPPRRRTR